MNNKILTFVGSGGVGKTTLSMSVAIYGATKGLKVAAITIDPSKRLARTLGLTSHSFKELMWESFHQPIDVFFLDAEEAFSEFVESSLSESMHGKIKKNKIFQQISKNLRETHNFAAIYKLDKILSNKKYDLIILDTPPSHQAIDFFESPIKLQKFFTQKNKSKKTGILNWIQEKGFDAIETLMMSVAGKEFVVETENFFSHIGKLRENIYKVSQNFVTYMKDEKSQLILVGSPSLDKINEATYLQEAISKQHYSIHRCVINRAYYNELDLSKGPVQIQDPKEQELYNYFKEQKQRSFGLIENLISQECFRDTKFIMLPEFSDLSETEESLKDLAKKVSEHWELVNCEGK